MKNLLATTISTESIEAFHKRPLSTCVHRHSSDRYFARRILAQLLGQGEKLLLLVGLERDQIFLFAETECVRHVDLYVLEPLADHKVFLDQRVPLFTGLLVPV